MKREAFNHPKIQHVARDLNVDLCTARGIVESLWMVTALNWPRGDIGRWCDEDIAVAIGYSGEGGHLIGTLLRRRLLDRIEDGRLYVHDWHVHADDAVQVKVARAGQVFANGIEPKLTKLSKAERADLKGGIARNANGDRVRTPCAQCAPVERTVSAPPEPEPLRGFPVVDSFVETRKSSSSSSSSAQNGKTTTMTTMKRFAQELLKTHPVGPGCTVAGNLKAATAALDDVGFTGELADRMRAAHEQAVAHWAATGPEYIPNLERWIESGEWERPPSAPKKPISRSMRLALELQAEREQKEARKR